MVAWLTSLSTSHMVSFILSPKALTKLLAGFTYCALAALTICNHLPMMREPLNTGPLAGIDRPQDVIRWLLRRLTTAVDEEDLEYGIETDNQVPSAEDVLSQWVGCSGRINKVADTCYVFWVVGSLSVSGNVFDTSTH